jgi:hypothetical protein
MPSSWFSTVQESVGYFRGDVSVVVDSPTFKGHCQTVSESVIAHSPTRLCVIPVWYREVVVFL